MGRARASPSARHRCVQRIAVLSLTPNRSAAARAELPAATAAVKRSLKSCDNGPGIFPTVTVILQTADSQTFRPM